MKFIRDTLLPRCNSQVELIRELNKLGLSLYYSKDDVPMGIEDTDSKRHSFKRCGITPQMWQALLRREEMSKINDRLNRLERIHNRNGQSRDQQREH